jgi:hypothetical protein
MTPGCTVAVRACVSRSRIRFMYLEKSKMTAAFTLCPDSPVPAPRARTGAPWWRQTSSAVTTSVSSRGITTPTGTVR